MKTLQIGAALGAAALALGACGKADNGNAITSDETISAGEANDAAPLDDNAIAGDLGDGIGNAADNAATGPANSL